MSTDRELLELAAKAIGRTITGWNHQRAGAEVAVLDDFTYWQPLSVNGVTDCDGDALRLAVNLGIYFMVVTEEGHVTARIRRGVRTTFNEDMCSDFMAATRRAIVRAAAKIGKTES